MKDCNGFKIIGVDHGFGNMKTANHCFPTGLLRYHCEPLFTKDLLIYDGGYYLIGEGHKEFLPDKSLDEDYFVLTLVAIAMELADEGLQEASVYLAVGMTLTWAAGQKEAFAAYLSRYTEVTFTFRKTDYRIRIVGVSVYPQGYAFAIKVCTVSFSPCFFHAHFVLCGSRIAAFGRPDFRLQPRKRRKIHLSGGRELEKLNENPQVEALLNALEQNGLHQEKAEVQSLVQYVGSMEKTLADMRSTLQSMREEVAKIHDSTLRGKCQKLADKADSRIKQSFATLKETKDNLLQSAGNALKAFREKGKDALAESIRAMKIPEALDKLAAFFQRQSKDMARDVVSVKAINAELQSTRGHLKNIGRVLVGKAPQEVAAPNPDKGILAMYAGTIEKEQKRYDSLAQKAMNAADKLRSARVKSLMANLNRCKEKAKRSAPPAPPLTHSRGHKPMEK